jgi:hypothetical protein
VHLALVDHLGARAVGARARRARHQEQLLDLPSAARQFGRHVGRAGPHQGGRAVRPAGVAAHVLGRLLDGRRVHRAGEQQPVVVAGEGVVRIEHRHSAGHVADADGAPDRQRRVVRERSPEDVVGGGQDDRGRRPVRDDADDRCHRQRAGQMREPHARRVRRHPGFEADRIGQPRGIDDEQHQVPAPGEQPLRGEVHLVGRGQVHEAFGPRAECAVAQGGPPARGLDQVQQQVLGHGGDPVARATGRMAG